MPGNPANEGGFMRKMLLLGIAFMLSMLAATNAAAQTQMLHLLKPRLCEPATLAAAKDGQYPIWRNPGVDPVVPEVLREIRKGGKARLVVAEALRGPKDTDAPERKAELLRAQQRIEQFNRLALFTPPGTEIDKLPELPDDFKELFEAATAVENLEESFKPCGSIIPFLTSAAPDRNGIAQIEVKGPHVLGWCDTMWRGQCGVWVVQSNAAIPITSGPNKDNFYRFCMIVNCGNPDAEFEWPKEEVQVTAPFTEPTEAMGRPNPPPPPPAGDQQGGQPGKGSSEQPKPRKPFPFDIDAGIKPFRGWIHTTYDCSTEPQKCDADQLHQNQGLMLTGQIIHRTTGWFGEGLLAVAVWNLNYAYEDPTAIPHDQEMGKDGFWYVLAGKQWALWGSAVVYVGGKVDGLCDCEHYKHTFKNLVETWNERSFLTYGAGAGIRGRIKRVGLRVDGTFQPLGNRKRWGLQTKADGTSYDRGNDDRQKAMNYGVDGEVGFPIWRLTLFTGGGWSLKASKRPGPASFEAYRESTQFGHLNVGLRADLGRFFRH